VSVLARNAEQNQLVLAELKAIGKTALVLRLDVTDRGALAPAVAEMERFLSRDFSRSSHRSGRSWTSLNVFGWWAV
jgi:hypothetical protein